MLTALEAKPQALYMLDDTTPLQDYSGYNRTATNVGTTITHPPLVKGAGYATGFSSVVIGSFASPVFTQGQESRPFTLEVWLFPSIVANDYQQVLGNLNQMDGLVIFGTTIHFVTKYSDATEARCSYDIGQPRRVHVVGTHTAEKNSLYVNGELVSEVEISATQQATTYVTTSASLSSGTSAQAAGAQRTALNGVTIYDYALDGATIERNYLSGIIDDEVVPQFNGDIIPVSMDNADIFLEQRWDTDEDWLQAELRNVVVVDNELVPQFNGDVSVAGVWKDNFPIDVAGTTSIYGLMISWEGTGAVVEASNNGTTWETVVSGRRSTTVSVGYNPTGKQIQLRVSFPGGITNDPAFIRNLHVVGLQTATTQPVGGRTVTYTNAMPQYERVPQEFMNDWGVWLNGATHTLNISADTVESTPLRTLELWVKRTGAIAPTISVSGTQYINGVASAGSLTIGQWTLLHIVLASDNTTGVTITGPGQVGQVGIYDTALSATDIANIYAAYFGSNVTRVSDTSVVGITEPATSATIYAHDWTIQGAG